MLIEEVDNVINHEETCKFCNGTGYDPDPGDLMVINYTPEPVPCRVCHGNGVIDPFGDD